MTDKIFHFISGFFALLMGLVFVTVITMPTKAMELGMTDKMFLISIALFFFFSSMWSFIDSHISFKKAYSESMQRIHATGEKYATFAIFGSVVLLLLVATI